MKKILVVSTVQTPPVQSGSQKCILEYCGLLESMGFEVYYLYVKGRKGIERALEAHWGDRLFTYERKWCLDVPKRGFIEMRKRVSGHNKVDDLYPVGLTRHVRRLQSRHRFDAVIANYLTLSGMFASRLDCKKILFAHDCLSFKKERLNVESFWFDLTPDQEAKGLRRCDVILSIQENETVYFRYLHPSGRTVTVYSHFKVTPQRPTGSKRILFLSGDSPLNVNGINYFISEVFPLVLEKEPGASLLVGGGICDVLPKIDSPNVVTLGRIGREADFYGLGDIAVNPIFQGTGLKIKTFEALSYGKVTVVHPHSAEGIFDPHAAPILVGRTPGEFAGHVVRALSDLDFRRACSEKSVAYIRRLNEHVRQTYRDVLS